MNPQNLTFLNYYYYLMTPQYLKKLKNLKFHLFLRLQNYQMLPKNHYLKTILKYRLYQSILKNLKFLNFYSMLKLHLYPLNLNYLKNLMFLM